MWIFRWILSAIIILLVLGFALFNMDQTASVSFLKWKSPILPLWFFMYLSFGVGLLFWVVVSAVNTLKLKGQIHRLEKDYKKLKLELNRLRNVNIEEEIEPETSEPDEDATVAES